ncbi:MAG: glycosyltransferase, partial [Nanoarchaeota archaeon]
FGTLENKPSIALVLESPLWVSKIFKRDVSKDIEWDKWGLYKVALLQGGYILDTTKEGSRHTLEWMGENFNKSKLLQCYCPVNNRACKKVPAAKERKNQIIHISRLTGYKNFLMPFEIAAEHKSKPHVVIIAGHAIGEYKRALEIESKKYGVSYELKEQISEEEKFKSIKESRLMTFPSLFEGQGLPPIEAALSITPVVVYDLPVMREIHTYDPVENKTWPKFAKWNDKDDFKQKCFEILDKPDVDKNNIAKVWSHYLRFCSIEAFENNLKNIVEQIIKK